MFPEYGTDKYGCSWILTGQYPGGQTIKESTIRDERTLLESASVFDFETAGGDKNATMAWEQSMPKGTLLSIYKAPPILGATYRTQNAFWAIVGKVTMVDNEVAYISPRVYQYVCPCEGIITAPGTKSALIPIIGLGLFGIGAVWLISKLGKK